MTIEEKARAYDEAFENAKKKYNSKYHPSEGPSGVYLNNADLEEIFPALKESEDERMMNRIICYLKQDIIEYPERKERIEDMLAYLERMKEQKSVDSEEKLESIDNSFRRGREVGFHEGAESVKRLRPQPHWKPSKEQIKAIDLAIRFVTDDFDEHPTLSETLSEFYNELLKNYSYD